MCKYWYDWLSQSESGVRLFRACFENRNKPKIKHIFLYADHRSAERRKKVYEREKNMFLNILALKHRFGKYKRNDEMINPNETEDIHTEKILCSFNFLLLCIFLWKHHLLHAKVNVNVFIFGKAVPRQTRF